MYIYIYICVTSGKLTFSYDKKYFQWVNELYMAIFNSKLLVYQRVPIIAHSSGIADYQGNSHREYHPNRGHMGGRAIGNSNRGIVIMGYQPDKSLMATVRYQS